MDYLEIIGKKNLSGSVKISGAKNAALPLLASTILASNEVQITNLPKNVYRHNLGDVGGGDCAGTIGRGDRRSRGSNIIYNRLYRRL